MNADGTAERVLGQVVIGDLHALWGLTAIRGRTLTVADERPGAPGVAVLSHRFWRTRFGGSMDIIGRDIRLDGQHRTLVGVLTPDIELGNISEIDVWLPYQGDATQASRTDRRGGAWAGWPAVPQSIPLTPRSPRSPREWHRNTRTPIATDSARVGPTKDALGTPSTWIVLSMLVTVVGLLLVLACANVMNLLIARLIARRQELAMRTALGGSRGRIVTQIVSESLVLGLAGGALGLAVAWGGLVAVRTVAYEPFFRQLAFDVRVVGFAAALAFVAPLVFSIVPTLRMLRADPATALNDATMRSIGSRSTARGQSALVVLQVTLGVTLLAVAGLIVKSMQTMTRIDTGYAVSGLLSTHIEIPTWKIADDREAFRIRQALVQRATDIPGVEGATTATELPALQLLETVTFAIENRVSEDRAGRPSAGITVASPAYFAVMGIPIVAGRGFADGDAASPAPVVVVSRAMAQRYWGGRRSRPWGTDCPRPLLCATRGIYGCWRVRGHRQRRSRPDSPATAVRAGRTPSGARLPPHRPSKIAGDACSRTSSRGPRRRCRPADVSASNGRGSVCGRDVLELAVERALRGFRDRGDAACHGGALRRDVLRCQPADVGDCHPHGARRVRARCRVEGHRSQPRPGRHRRGTGPRRGVRARASDAVSSLRCRARGPRHVSRRPAVTGGAALVASWIPMRRAARVDPDQRAAADVTFSRPSCSSKRYTSATR